jgi:pimeloyl-ACP methyl ester carboxylesterase
MSSELKAQQTASTSHIEVDGISFAYRYLKPTTQTTALPLLMFYHFRSSMDTWDPLVINGLLETRPVILYEHAGHGHSTGTIKNNIKGLAHDAVSFIVALQSSNVLAEKKIDVLGFSMGGYVAQQFTFEAPHLVNRLVLAGTGAALGPGVQNTPIDIISTLSATPDSFGAFINTLFTPLNYAAGEAWIARSRERATMKPAGEKFYDWISEPAEIWALVEAMISWTTDAVAYAILPAISQEVLVVAGQSDLIIPTANAIVLSSRLGKGLLHIYPDSGHGFLFQYHDKVVQLVSSFLDGNLL